MDDRFERYEIKLRRAFPLEESFLQQYEALPSSAKSVMVRKHVTDGYTLIRNRMNVLGESYTYKDAIYSLCIELGMNEEDFLVYLNYYTPPDLEHIDFKEIKTVTQSEKGIDNATQILADNGSHERKDFTQRDHNNLVNQPQKQVHAPKEAKLAEGSIDSNVEPVASVVTSQSSDIDEIKQNGSHQTDAIDNESDINKEAKEKIKKVLNW
ncbi:hypothetical protein [Yersinia ruckeri]|uniref:hypothetical protein n=1 Tax=Yersinia ruckeri TaxID=29486 RepID=UPI0020BFE35C|nr:hypothetical protein [Yersinia ruckeri]UZY16877.1 hypothetical protein LNQ37_017365 [Yersinia ruckeri]